MKIRFYQSSKNSAKQKTKDVNLPIWICPDIPNLLILLTFPKILRQIFAPCYILLKKLLSYCLRKLPNCSTNYTELYSTKSALKTKLCDTKCHPRRPTAEPLHICVVIILAKMSACAPVIH